MEAVPMGKSADLRGSPTFFVDDSEDGLAHIFSYLNFEDLCACRLVSKFWFDVSLRFWMVKAPTIRLYEKGNKEHGAHWSFGKNIANFLKRFQDEAREYSKFEGMGIRQFQKFRLQFAEPSAAPESKLNKLKQQFKRWGFLKLEMEKTQCEVLHGFLAICGCWITRLNLDDFTFPDMQTFEDVMYCKFTPELKELNIREFRRRGGMSPFGGHRHLQLNWWADKEFKSQNVVATKITSLRLDFNMTSGRKCPIKWTRFLEHYPKLKKLWIRTWDANDNQEWDILDAISQIREADKTKLQLTELDVHDRSTLFKSPERLLAFYRQTQLPIIKLEIYAFENITIDFVFDLIKLHSRSLKELYILNNGALLWNQRWNPPLVVEGLQKLKIWGLPVFRDLGFLTKFPNLKYLEVNTFSQEGGCNLISSTAEADMDGFVMGSLTKFNYEYDEICGPAEIRKIQKWMPNLRRLSIAVSEDGEAAVQLLLPQLESTFLRPRQV